MAPPRRSGLNFLGRGSPSGRGASKSPFRAQWSGLHEEHCGEFAASTTAPAAPDVCQTSTGGHTFDVKHVAFAPNTLFATHTAFLHRLLHLIINSQIAMSTSTMAIVVATPAATHPVAAALAAQHGASLITLRAAAAAPREALQQAAPIARSWALVVVIPLLPLAAAVSAADLCPTLVQEAHALGCSHVIAVVPAHRARTVVAPLAAVIARVETTLRIAPLPTTVLRCAPLAQPIATAAVLAVRETRRVCGALHASAAQLALPVGVAQLHLVDARDVADAAAQCVARNVQGTLTLAGPDGALSGPEIARRAAAALGVPLRYINRDATSTADAAAMLAPWIAPFLAHSVSRTQNATSNACNEKQMIQDIQAVFALAACAFAPTTSAVAASIRTNSVPRRRPAADLVALLGREPRPVDELFREQRAEISSVTAEASTNNSSFTAVTFVDTTSSTPSQLVVTPPVVQPQLFLVGTYGGGLGRFVPMPRL